MFSEMDCYKQSGRIAQVNSKDSDLIKINRAAIRKMFPEIRSGIRHIYNISGIKIAQKIYYTSINI
jgi:hypothetical protein